MAGVRQESHSQALTVNSEQWTVGGEVNMHEPRSIMGSDDLAQPVDDLSSSDYEAQLITLNLLMHTMCTGDTDWATTTGIKSSCLRHTASGKESQGLRLSHQTPELFVGENYPMFSEALSNWPKD